MDKEAPRAIAASAVDCDGVYPTNYRLTRSTATALITVFEDGSREISCPKMASAVGFEGVCNNNKAVGNKPETCTHFSPQKKA